MEGSYNMGVDLGDGDSGEDVDPSSYTESGILDPEAEQLVTQIQKEFMSLNKSIRNFKLSMDYNQTDQREEISKKILISLKIIKKKLRTLKTKYCAKNDMSPETQKLKNIFKGFHSDFESRKKKYQKLKDQSMRTELIATNIDYVNDGEGPERELRDFKNESHKKVFEEDRSDDDDSIPRGSRSARKEPRIREERLFITDDEEDGEFDNEEVSNQLFKEVFEIQDENVELVEMLLNKADKANEQATEVNEALQVQNERLLGLKDLVVTRLAGEIRQASREIRSFLRGVVSDKLLVVCCCLCVCVVMICVLIFVICRCYVCTIICNTMGEEAIEKCKKIPLMYLDSK